ncbi:MAG: N-acetylmuramoyl-L-alanine amidase [Nocardioides sp.]|uniref:N-acetylmuramoyl-L-alanine amidase n=1 Tax=Nocardioides sp. TaxID=35761 RepID=UPI003EFFC0C8
MFRLGSHSSHTVPTLARASAAGVVGLLGVAVLSVPPAVGSGVAHAAPAPVSEVGLSPVGGGLRSAEVPLGSDSPTGASLRAGAAARTVATDGFTMVGATWRGARDPGLQVRVRQGGTWGTWQDLEPLGDGPDADTAEGRRTEGSGATDLLWVGRSRDLQVRAGGSVPAGAELVLTDTSAVPATTQTRAPASAAARSTVSAAPRSAKSDGAPRPRIRSRKVWGANEKWRDGEPTYGKNIKQVHVHHTVNSNDYDRDDVAGIIRGIYRYHTKSLGWSDIGYNVLVDRFGRAWVGRWGGIAKRVQGAHTLGFNHNSTGIAVIGNFETTEPRKSVRRRIARISAWLLDREGRRATGTVVRISHGSDKFPEGRKVRLAVIDGHRDTNDTACPGQELYDVLSRIRGAAQFRINRY